MKTFLIAVLGAAVLVLPAAAVAKPDHADKRAAIKQCKAERGKTKATHKAFKARYHSFSRCVRQNAAEEHAEKRAALKNAAKQCKAERSDPGFPAAHDGKTFVDWINPQSLEVLQGCKLEPSLAGVASGSRFQFERQGYFCADPDSSAGTPVFNRTVSLKDSWTKQSG